MFKYGAVCLPGVPAISTLNVHSMVLFSNGDPLWSLEDKKQSTFYFSWPNQDLQSFLCVCGIRHGNESQRKNASTWMLVCVNLWLWLLVLLLLFFAWKNVETLTLETLGSKEVARWLVWLQNTKEHG